jgi:N4-gp56 family major capsid protein
MGQTNTTVIPAEVGTFYNRTLLRRAVPLFVHTKWAQVKDIPRKAGSLQIKFRRYGNLSYATTALTEGITPAGSQLSVTDITADVAQYGDFITVTDVLDFESEDPVLTEAAEILGDQAGGTLDVLTRNVLAAGTNVYYGGDATSRVTVAATTDLITTTLINKAVRTLKNGLARKLTRMVDASTGYATAPLNASFIGIVHPNVSYTLKDLTGFVKVENYANKNSVMEGEIGSYGEVRFIESTNAKVFSGEGASGIDVYATLIFGSDAYGISRISGEAMKNIVKPLGSAGTADPLDQRATSGWKATFVAKILNNDFLVRLETCVAA